MSESDDMDEMPDNEIPVDHSGNAIWITKDKKRIRIVDMDIDHINNVLRMLSVNDWGEYGELYIMAFEEELELRKNKYDT